MTPETEPGAAGPNRRRLLLSGAALAGVAAAHGAGAALVDRRLGR